MADTGDSRAKQLIADGDQLFGKRPRLMALWQEIANHFYVERADFLVERTVGDNFADWLTTSYPLIVRRDLGNTVGAMLRPTAKEWFNVGTTRPDREDDEARRWFDYARSVQRRAMYDRATQFVRATKEGDHDWVAFGQCVISAELNSRRDAMLYRCWNLRDVAWCENDEGRVDTVHRKWKGYAKDAARRFPKTISPKLKELADKKPYEEIELRHIVLPTEVYQTQDGGKKIRQPFVSIFLETDTATILEEVGSWNLKYAIPRWQTVSGSQYSYSPATCAALPDARLIQAQTLTLLEAGERFTSPPMIAVQDAIRSDLQLYAGGVTWVDSEYDERLGEVLRPLSQDKSGMPIGRDMVMDVRAALAEAFYLNKVALPNMGQNPEMTAFEVGQRIQEYIRQTLPLFEPMEMEYNGALCEITFDELMRGGAFGSHSDIPRSVRGQDIQFSFVSPLSEAIDAQKAGKLAEAKQIIAQVADLDPMAARRLDTSVALPDALRGAAVPEAWIRGDKEMKAIADYEARLQQSQQMLAAMQASATAVKTMGEAGQSLNAANAGSAGQSTAVA